MIIAGFAGVGKTHFCKNNRNAIDFVCMPFKYSNFYEVSMSLAEEEDIKANVELDFVLFWDEYYYYALMDTYKKYPDMTIIIPTVTSILKRLKEDHIPVTVVYPNIKDKNEYERRYKSRGNSDAFMEVFLERWEQWFSSIQKMDMDNTIILSADQYLSDVIKTVPSLKSDSIQDKEMYIYETYFKNGLAKGFVETPIGKLMDDCGAYR